MDRLTLTIRCYRVFDFYDIEIGNAPGFHTARHKQTNKHGMSVYIAGISARDFRSPRNPSHPNILPIRDFIMDNYGAQIIIPPITGTLNNTIYSLTPYYQESWVTYITRPKCLSQQWYYSALVHSQKRGLQKGAK